MNIYTKLEGLGRIFQSLVGLGKNKTFKVNQFFSELILSIQERHKKWAIIKKKLKISKNQF